MCIYLKTVKPVMGTLKYHLIVTLNMSPLDLSTSLFSYSSAIRKAISEGDMPLTEKLLGRPYSLRERVVNGQHLARKLGFSTANQIFPDKKAVLRYGVYRVRVKIGKKFFYGISNIGMRPTVNGSLLCAETHIFNFEGDLYGKFITVEFLEFIRPEQKFDSIEELEKQIKKDIKFVQKLS